VLSPVRSDNKVVVLVSGKKVPANAQISIAPEQKKVDLLVKFRSGFKIRIEESTYKITKEQLVIDSESSQVFIQHKNLLKSESSATFGKVLKKAFKEKNYILDKNSNLRNYSQIVKEEDMEFAPSREGRSLLLFALSFPGIPQQVVPVRVKSKRQLGTYSRIVEIPLEKSQDFMLVDSSDQKIEETGEQNESYWRFKAAQKGEFNRDWLSIKNGESSKPTYYSAQVYRGYSGSIAARAAISSGLKSAVPGIQFQADYWLEKLFSKKSLFFQRWGVGAGYSKALAKFAIPGFGDDLEQSSAFVDIMYRFTPGVRPLSRSWGMGLRYFDIGLLGGQRGDIDPTLYGVGLFWHTAPIGALDAAVNAIPFFKCPKWMEISAYYYPFTTTEGFDLVAALSVQARGRLMFSKRGFLDAGINYHYLNFKREFFAGSSTIVEGSLGLGFNF